MTPKQVGFRKAPLQLLPACTEVLSHIFSKSLWILFHSFAGTSFLGPRSPGDIDTALPPPEDPRTLSRGNSEGNTCLQVG